MTQAPATPELVERLRALVSRFAENHAPVAMFEEAADALEFKERSLALAGKTLMKLDLKIHELEALADRYEKALRPFVDALASFNAERWDDETKIAIELPTTKRVRPMSYVRVSDLLLARQALSSQGRREGGEEPAGVYRGWKGVTQPCDVCGKSVAVNAVSPSECHCSEACGLIAYGLDKPSPDNTNHEAEHG